MEQQVADLSAAAVEVAQGLEQLRNRYEQLLDKQTRRFTDALQQAGWLIPGAMPQTRIWAERVQPGPGRAVVFWVDALRYEMGASLHERFSGWSREQLSDLKLEIAQAALPPITPVGMSALLPGAERGFAVIEGDGEPCSVVDGVPVGWSDDKAKRLAHLQQRVPSAVVLNLVELIRSKEAVLLEKLAGTGPVVITSIGIDDAGERDKDEPLANVRADMQRELDTIEEAVRRLAALPLDHRLERFVITADHGFLHLPLGREPAMRIPPPAGKTFKLERRCWLGHPSAVQEPCIEIPPAELGYGSKGLSVVVPRSAGVFKAGGSLCYHHGGTSPQEVLIPLLSFRCNPAGAAARRPTPRPPRANAPSKPAWPGELPGEDHQPHPDAADRAARHPAQPGPEPPGGARRLRQQERRAGRHPHPGHRRRARTGTNRLTLTPGQAATIGLMLPAEVSAKKLYLELRDAATDLVLHKSPDLPVDLIG